MIKRFVKKYYRQRISKKNKNRWLKTIGIQNEDFDLKSWKTNSQGDTFFIFGSGSSINNITGKEWESIKENTSVGLNFWCIHDYVPNYYIGEIPNGDRAEPWLKQLESRLDEYKKKNVRYNIKVPYVQNDIVESKTRLFDQFKKNPLFKNVNFISTFPIYTNSKASLIKQVDSYLNEVDRKDKIDFLVQIRGSIIGAYVLGISLGFKKIVFCGIDLNDNKYFYDEDREYYENQGRIVPTTGYAPGQVHGNIRPVENTLDVCQIIDLLNLHFMATRGIKTYNINPHSRLAEILPLYEA